MSRSVVPRRSARRRSPALALLVASLAVAGAVLPAQAQVPTAAAPGTSFTPAQRAEIVAVVRDALKTDPSILSDAVLALRASAQQKEEADAGAAVRGNRASLSGQPGDAILGNPRGDVTMVEFYDPRCPYCRKVLPDLEALLDGDHKLRLVEKLIPILGPNSLLDAQAIQAAGAQNKYAALQRALMTDSAAPGLDRIKSVAAATGLDVARLLQDMKSPDVNDVLERNVALAHTLHITGTPSFVIGDQIVPGAMALADLRDAVRTERAAR